MHDKIVMTSMEDMRDSLKHNEVTSNVIQNAVFCSLIRKGLCHTKAKGEISSCIRGGGGENKVLFTDTTCPARSSRRVLLNQRSIHIKPSLPFSL
jgi:hypothetical protein